jgi:L-fuculose-phosphate aldolase
MDLSLLHPRDQITTVMERIYGYGMTTTSGGNLSVRDEEGNIWITPAGTDKGLLRPDEVVRVGGEGATAGELRPSSEWVFHHAVYEARADVGAVLHAHPAALVSFCILGEVPDTRVIPKAKSICGEVGWAPYALPGSETLAGRVVEALAGGLNVVLLENHGVVCVGADLFEAFRRFETLDFCARLILKARTLGRERPLPEPSLAMFEHKRHYLPEYEPTGHTGRELELRKQMCAMIQRAYEQQLVTSTEGTFSCRLEGGDFVITPYGVDRKYVEARDLIVIRGGHRERGRIPSRSVLLHQRVYDREPGIGAVIIAHPPNVMAFGVSGETLDTRLIPESYVVLREIGVLKYGPQFNDLETLAGHLRPDAPMLLVENDCLVATGRDLLQAYDRLEVAEFTAKALIAARAAGEPGMITEEQVRELREAFGLGEGADSSP